MKVNNGEYLLMWTQNGKLKYCTIDGKGDVSSQIYEMSGALSDCVPMISVDKAIWYVWEDETVTFYSINLLDLSVTNAVKIKNGHDFKITYPESGDNVVKKVCQREGCGYKYEFTTITSFSNYWKYSENDDGYYWSYYLDEVKTGSWYDVMLTNLYPENVDDTSVVMTSSDKSVATIKDKRIDFVGKGKVTITLKARYNPDCKRKVTFYSEVKITGIGEYMGSCTERFTIKKASNKITASDVTKSKKNKKQTFNLKANALEDAKLTYMSSNSKIKVNESGKVTIPSGFSGSTTITIKAAATKNYKKTSKKVKVTVKK